MIHTVPETGSTNADLLARIAASDPMAEGDWLVADRQTAGRGRMGREWRDGAGNFMGSTTVHLRDGDPPAASLALSAGLAVHRAIASYGATPLLKWPNDLLIGVKKVAGILLEASDGQVVVGIGVNLVSAPDIPDRPATSLGAHAVDLSRDAFAAELVGCFADVLADWRGSGLPALIERWLAAAHPLGTALTVQQLGDAPVSGSFAGLTQEGALKLALASGELRVIQAGDVMLADPADRG